MIKRLREKVDLPLKKQKVDLCDSMLFFFGDKLLKRLNTQAGECS